jgi:hypothetical protein
MRKFGRSADDEPTLTPEEQRTLSMIEAELRRDVRLDRALTPRRHRASLLLAPVWAQALVAVAGVALMVAGLVSRFVIVAAPGFIALVLATSALTSRWSANTVIRARRGP